MSPNDSSHRDRMGLRGKAGRMECLTYEQERSLLAAAKAGKQDALLLLVESHMRLVVDIARRYARPAIPTQDLVGEGTVGLVEAIRRFECTRDTRLSTYAKWWIRARVRAYALANRNLIATTSTRAGRLAASRHSIVERSLSQRLGRPPVLGELASALEIPLPELEAILQARSSRVVPLELEGESSSFEPEDRRLDPEQTYGEAEEREQVAKVLRSVLSQLTERERMVLEAQLSDGKQTLREVGEALGITRQRASQIAADIRKRLREHMPAVAC
jgi:RNA polymerase sigma factor (sigma-70 family)